LDAELAQCRRIREYWIYDHTNTKCIGLNARKDRFIAYNGYCFVYEVDKGEEYADLAEQLASGIFWFLCKE
jgi:hypothetical protein